uniref:Uncharacterized protein n=1 Tax=Arundo donax TaxID=35708 RepID=A0A0A9ENN3_ARUDO
MCACSFSSAALKSAASATTAPCSATLAGYATNLPVPPAAGGGIDTSTTFSFPFRAAAAAAAPPPTAFSSSAAAVTTSGGALISPAHTRPGHRHRQPRSPSPPRRPRREHA